MVNEDKLTKILVSSIYKKEDFLRLLHLSLIVLKENNTTYDEHTNYQTQSMYQIVDEHFPDIGDILKILFQWYDEDKIYEYLKNRQ